MFSKDIEKLHTIVVASSMSGEGKSSLASHLALSLARATGDAVLLVDADMRSPDQHHLFGLDLGVGLSGVLAGKARLEQAIDRSLGDRLHVLTAGKLEGSPHRLATRDNVEVLLGEAKEDLSIHRYRYCTSSSSQRNLGVFLSGRCDLGLRHARSKPPRSLEAMFESFASSRIKCRRNDLQRRVDHSILLPLRQLPLHSPKFGEGLVPSLPPRTERRERTSFFSLTHRNYHPWHKLCLHISHPPKWVNRLAPRWT